MPRNLDTALLRSFVVAVEAGGMTAAARRLHLTQAAVSQQIKRLEEAMQTSLLERERRGLRLTPAGEKLLGRAQRLLALNDEIWSAMTVPEFAGEVRLGVPHDIVGPFIPPVLKRFDQAWPKVQVGLVCSTSPRLLEMLREGAVDLTLTTETAPGPGGEVLAMQPLLWVGGRGGNAWRRDPLPVALGDETCAFRPVLIAALEAQGRDWRSVCDIGSTAVLDASLSADLAVAAYLSCAVPDTLEVLESGAGLPALPHFGINLYLPRVGGSEIAVELASHIRDAFAAASMRAAA